MIFSAALLVTSVSVKIKKNIGNVDKYKGLDRNISFDLSGPGPSQFRWFYFGQTVPK